MNLDVPDPAAAAALVIAQEHCRVTGRQYIDALLKHDLGSPETLAALDTFAQAGEDVGRAFRAATT